MAATTSAAAASAAGAGKEGHRPLKAHRGFSAALLSC